MDSKDQFKIIQEGFTIIRASEVPTFPNGRDQKPEYINICIKYKDKFHKDWATLEKGFTSRTQRDRRMEELLRHPLWVKE